MSRYSPTTTPAPRPATSSWAEVEASTRRARESITEAIGLLEALARACEARAAANDNGRAA